MDVKIIRRGVDANDSRTSQHKAAGQYVTGKAGM
jgi:hypothetical protein